MVGGEVAATIIVKGGEVKGQKGSTTPQKCHTTVQTKVQIEVKSDIKQMVNEIEYYC